MGQTTRPALPGRIVVIAGGVVIVRCRIVVITAIGFLLRRIDFDQGHVQLTAIQPLLVPCDVGRDDADIRPGLAVEAVPICPTGTTLIHPLAGARGGGLHRIRPAVVRGERPVKTAVRGHQLREVLGPRADVLDRIPAFRNRQSQRLGGFRHHLHHALGPLPGPGERVEARLLLGDPNGHRRVDLVRVGARNEHRKQGLQPLLAGHRRQQAGRGEVELSGQDAVLGHGDFPHPVRQFDGLGPEGHDRRLLIRRAGYRYPNGRSEQFHVVGRSLERSLDFDRVAGDRHRADRTQREPEGTHIEYARPQTPHAGHTDGVDACGPGLKPFLVELSENHVLSHHLHQLVAGRGHRDGYRDSSGRVKPDRNLSGESFGDAARGQLHAGALAPHEGEHRLALRRAHPLLLLDLFGDILVVPQPSTEEAEDHDCANERDHEGLELLLAFLPGDVLQTLLLLLFPFPSLIGLFRRLVGKGTAREGPGGPRRRRASRRSPCRLTSGTPVQVRDDDPDDQGGDRETDEDAETDSLHSRQFRQFEHSALRFFVCD